MPISPELLKQVGGVITKPTNALDINKLGNGAGLTPLSQPEPKPADPVNKTNTLDLSTLDTSHGTVKPKASVSATEAIAAGKADPITKTDIQFKQPTFQDDLYSAGQNFNIGAASNFESLASGTKTLKARIEAQVKAQPEIWASGLLYSNPEQKPLIDKIIAQKFAESLANNDSVDNILTDLAKGYHETARNYQDDLNTLKAKAGQDFTQVSFVDKLAQAAPSMIPLAVASLVSGGGADIALAGGYLRTAGVLAAAAEILPTVGEATQQAQSDYDQQLSEGKTPEEAMKVFDSSLSFNLALLAISNKFSGIWKPENYKGLLELVKTSLEEGAQEAGQQIYSNVLDKQNWFKDVPDNFLVGSILGFGVKGVTSVGGVNLQENQLSDEAGTPPGGGSGGGSGDAFNGFHLIPEDQYGGKQPSKEDLKKQIEESDAPQDKKDEAIKFLDTTDEQTRGEILQNAVDDGSLNNFVQEIKNNNNERDAQIQQLQDLYQQQVAAGISPTIIYQEISDRTGIPAEDIKSTIQELETRPKASDPITQIADELIGQANPLTEKLITPEDKIGSLAEQTLQQDEATAPNVVKDMENDAEMQADWERNYQVEYGDYNRQEVYLRGQDQRYTQRAAKARVQGEIARIEGKKRALQEEYKKNNTEVTKSDVEKAQKEKNPTKANRVLNQVGKEKTSKVVKNGKGVVRVNRITDTEKVSKRQAEKRAKVENPSFLELKKGIHPLNETTDEQNQTIEQSKFQDLIRGVDVRQNAYETSFTIGNTTFRFDTQTFNDFMQGRDPNEISYYVKGNEIFLVDMNYGDWEMNSIVGQVIEQTPQASTLFQRSSRHRFATPRDIEKAFDNIPFLKYVRIEKVNEIKTPGGGGAWGSYFDGLIKYTETSKYGTLPHEAFHAFTDLVLTPEERQTMYDTARVEMYNDGYTLPITDLQTEEYLAEKFEDYYINKTEQSSLSRFFDKIIQALKSLVQSKKTIDDYFNSVFDPQVQLYQKPNREIKPISGEFILAFSPKTVEEAREIVDGAEITEEEKNFLYAVLDNPAYSKKTNWDAVMDEMKIRALQVEGRVLNGRQNMIVRGDEELGINPDNGFAWVVSTNLEHGERTSHGFTDGGNAIAWANVAETKDGWGEYIVKEIQKISGAVLNPAINNSDYTAQEKKEAKTLHQNYMDLMVISLLDKAANDGKIIKFPSPENAQRVNTQADPELIEKVYEKQMVTSLKKFAEPELMSNPDGEWYVVYPSQVAKQNAHRFQTADVFESIQQNHLTTKILNRLGDRKTVSKTFISDLAKMPDIKAKEKEIINEVLKGESATINVEEFKQKVRAELLPLEVVSEGSSSDEQTVQYEAYTLDNKERGSVREYLEKVYGSPIKTSAGDRHFRGVDNYFGHTRVERMSDGETIRVVEVQTDLFQKNNFDAESLDKWEITPGKAMLEFENGNQVFALETNPMTGELEIGEEMKSSKQIGDSQYWAFAAKNKERNSELKKLEVYGNPTSHFRMAREEINHFAKSASDYKRIQFPTGITALKIEGHWSRYAPTSNTEPDHGWVMYVDQTDSFAGEVRPLKPTDLKAGLIVKDRYGTKWIVVYIKPTGEMVVSKYNNQFIEDAKEQDPDFEGTDFEVGQRYAQSIFDHIEEDAGSFYGAESFNIGRVKTSDEYKKNPLYKFYEGDLGKYLKNTFNAKEVTDAQGVTWFEIALTPEMAGRVEAFQEQNVYDKMAKALVELQMRNRENSMNQTFAQRTAEELDIILNSQGIKYTPSMIKEEMAKSELAYKKDKVKSIELALKGESPKDILPLAFGKYVLGKVTQEGNVDTQRKVLEKISTTATVMGQNIAMLKGRVNLDDPNSFASKLLQQKKQLAIRNWKPIFGKAKTIEEIVETEVKVQKKRVKKLSEELLQAKTLEMEAFFEAIKC